MNEVTKQDTNLTTYQPSPSQVIKSDVVIPKITLMQAMSDLVKAEKAKAGQMVRSSNSEAIGNETMPIDFIPLTIKNDWLISEGTVDPKSKKVKYKFKKYEARTNKNEGDEWDYVEDNIPMKRTKILTVFALLPQDIEIEKKMVQDIENGDTPNVDGVLLPVAIQFKGSSFKSGRDISTLFAKAESISRTVGKNVPVYGTTMRLSCVEEANDDGSFFVYKTQPTGKTKEDYRKACASWYAVLNSNNEVKVDESDMVKTQAFHSDAKPVDVGF